MADIQTPNAPITGLYASYFNLEKLETYNDPLVNNAWALIIPVVPGYNTQDSVTAGRAMTIQCQSAASPVGYDIQALPVQMQRLVYNYAGGLKHRQDMPMKFFDTYNCQVYRVLQQWRDQTVDYESGLNYAKATYATTAFLYHMGVNGLIALQYQLNGFWINKIETEAYEVGPEGKLYNFNCNAKFDFLTNPIAMDVGQNG